MSNYQDSLSKVLRNIEADLGTSQLAELFLQNTLDSLDNFQIKSVDDFYEQFRELLTCVKTTKPRIGILIFHFCELWELLQDRKDSIQTLEELKEVISSYIQLTRNENESDSLRLQQHGLDCIEDGDSILIHTHSRTVLNLLIAAFKQKKKIKVVMAEQEFEKTQDMVRCLQGAGVPFVTVPEFMLSHIEQEVNKVFLGALTLNNSYNFVTDVGATSVVSEFHHAKVPIYMFLTTKKFSLWDTKKHQQTYKVTQKKAGCHPELMLTYDRIKFSHDRVPLELMTKVITENGVYKPAELKKIFDTRYEDYDAWRKRYL